MLLVLKFIPVSSEISEVAYAGGHSNVHGGVECLRIVYRKEMLIPGDGEIPGTVTNIVLP